MRLFRWLAKFFIKCDQMMIRKPILEEGNSEISAFLNVARRGRGQDLGEYKEEESSIGARGPMSKNSSRKDSTSFQGKR